MRLFVVVSLSLLAGPAWADEPRAKPDLVRLRDVTYATRDGLDLKADVLMPLGEGPFPAVLMIHGGGWMVGTKWQISRPAHLVARRGYVVVAIDYRKAPRNPFPAQILDCREALRWMRRNASQYKLNPDCIAAYGYSAGGHLASLLGVNWQPPGDGTNDSAAARPGENSLRVQAVVAGGAPCDFSWIPETSKALAYWLGGSRSDLPDAYRSASPLTYVSADDPPFFFFHGQNDAIVPKASAESLLTALQKAGVSASMHTAEGKGHALTYLNEESHRAAIRFLDQTLKGK